MRAAWAVGLGLAVVSKPRREVGRKRPTEV